MNAVETIEKDNCTVEIYQEDYPMNPREWDNLGTMVCFHNRYDLGDDCTKFVKGHYYIPDFEAFQDFYANNWKKMIFLPLYLYDHSGITISTSNEYPYNDRWDAGQVGYIFVTYEKIREEFGYRKMTKERREKIKQYLINEVKTYDQYLTGDVYGYQVTCNQCGEEIDSCWGFYGQNWKDNGLLDQVYTTCDTCKEMEKRLEQVLA